MEAIYKHHAPELMNRFFDIMSVQKGLTKILIDFSSAIFIVAFSLLLLSFYHSFFILFSIVLLILLYAIFRYTAKEGMATSLQESKYKYKVAHWLEEIARTNTSFKLAGKTTLPLKRINKYVDKYLVARSSHFKVLVQQYSLLIVFKVVIAAGLLAMGGILVMEQQMNIGQFIAAEIIILIVMVSVEKLILSAESIYDILTSLEKIGQVTDLELEREDGIALKPDKQKKGIEIELKNVSFTYPEANNKTLDNISISIKSGEICIFAGENNSGKSTMLSVIAGLFDIQEGSILINSLPIGNLSLVSIRAQIGEYFSVDKLFEGTIVENITLGKDNISNDDIKWAIQNLELDEFIQGRPQGFNTVLCTRGNGLSKSIITKLLLARAIVHKPKLLLLENVFEHLDVKSCRHIIDFLTDKQNQWTIIAATSNPYLASKSDNIAVFKDGKIIDFGTIDKVKDKVNFKIKGVC